MKKKGLISFSGGETSAFMLWWLLQNKSDEYDFTIIFANTGRENDETLEFVKKCSEHFGCEIIWVEAVIHPEYRKGTTHKVVTFETATRNQDWKRRKDTPYEMMVKKYGLSNISNRNSTRELKERPIHSYMKSIGFKKKEYETFIGIRVDEFDRMNSGKSEYKFNYPLVSWKPFTKKHVNFWWSEMPFRLELKGWEGNCVTCYKKNTDKLAKIMIDDPWKFEFEEYLEKEYGFYIPDKKKEKILKEGRELPELPIRIFRENKTVADIRNIAQSLTKEILNDSENTDIQLSFFDDEESCEVFSQCGN
ncbi:phosphoadenosine phosphosulfate reductase domain-containing protein [Elizabethkingia meningoseptica]|uniref:phosphoadenosine phosphosulfate reductase domain-containing protein n=1 Tax=Elizabethkingia meningoseptica TaxID=238 RepID=UPI0016258C7D|nr:phosphoadenosine phosphosulfate reductase family protein [Elizabethkingia meningoseptica]MBG0512907.1 phosphoadenosine phosphosulfate reductase family protein [Elizabethkingia meningoseptica]MBG0515174.1 phosphoadenosine phosphosulfate reductase family protein [Elizabethkingia meningoseptica]